MLAAYTGSVWRSLLVAALFALHPLHVESVAWVAERKDLLAALFWFFGLGAYLAWLRRPSPSRLAALAALFAAALMAKPVAVTFPAALLLLDWWPLGRLRGRRDLPRLFIEKTPLWIMAAASSSVTVLAQRAGDSFASAELYPAWARLANAVRAYLGYLGLAIWPAGLTVFHPHPGRVVPVVPVILAALALAAATLAVAARRRALPWLATGWLWYLGVLVPMIGLVQVGDQGMADRYTYLPLTGIFMALAWSLPRLQSRARLALGAGALVLLAALGVASRRQVAVWRSSETLFAHALAVSPGNYVALVQVRQRADEPGPPGRGPGALPPGPGASGRRA